MAIDKDLLEYLNLISANSTSSVKARSLSDSLATTKDGIIEDAKKSVALNDSFGNPINSTGTEDKIKHYNDYNFTNTTLNWPLWLAIYNDSWVFRRAIDKPAQDEINCGIMIHGEGDYTSIYRAFDSYKFDLIQLLQWGALFGGSVAVMMFDGITDEDMQKPLDVNKIYNKRMRLYVTDRWYGVESSNENVTNMRDIDFGTPKYYNISFADGKMISNIHHSYVLRYEHRTAPKLIKCGQLQGWGYAEGAHIFNELMRDDQLKSAITSLINKSSLEIIKMAGMKGVFMGADKGNEEQLRKRLEMVNWGRNFNSLTFLDKDDEYQHFELSNISGLSNILETNMWLIAASLEMQGILFGDLKGGLSQESDALRRYAITIKNRCDSYVRPVIKKLLMVLFKIYGIDEPVDFTFNSLISEELNAEKMESISKYSNILQNLVSQGIISKYQAAISMQGLINKNVVSINITEVQLNRLKMEEETEILAAYKNAGKGTPTDIISSEFPNRENIPEKLSYIKEELNDFDDKVAQQSNDTTNRSEVESQSSQPEQSEQSTESEVNSNETE